MLLTHVYDPDKHSTLLTLHMNSIPNADFMSSTEPMLSTHTNYIEDP